MSGDRGPISRYVFDLFREGLNQYHEGLEERLGQLEDRLREHERAHANGRSGNDVEVRERRRWSWPEIVVAIITAGGVVAAATITALSR